MSNLAFQDTFEPYYEGRDGLAANTPREGTIHRLPQPKERRPVQAPPIEPHFEENAKR